MASSPYASTPETTNASRASRLLLGPCTDGLRDVLRHCVPPQTFPHVIKQKKSNLPKLSSQQKNLILPQHGNYNGSYGDMDISLLYILLRNICNLQPHSNGWGNNPGPNDKSISANIERIRLARNQIGHSLSTSLSHADFTTIWSTIRAAMVDLDIFLSNGNNYEKDIDVLRHETMDPEREQHYQDELKKQVIEDQKTREMIDDLRKEVLEIKESSIPHNVREQCRINLQEWREDDKLYFETHNFSSMIDKVRNQTFVTFVGVPGSGKSATAHHIALKLHEEGYEVVPTRNIKKLEEYCDPRKPQVFVIDDVVGVLGLQKTKLHVLADYKRSITTPCMAKSKTLMTCREVVFNEVLSYKPFFTDEATVVKLHSFENALNDNDKKEILRKYGLNAQKYDLDVDLLLPSLPASTSRMFPLLCKLFSKEKNFKALGEKFFKKPVQCIIDEFDSMQRENKLHYATLVLCVMKENCLSRDDLNDEDFEKRKRDVLEKCKLKSHTDTFKFRDALSAMEGTYTKQNADGQYSFIHDSIYEICAYHFGKQFPDQILEYMSIIYISNFVKPQTNERRMVEEQTFTHSHYVISKENECRSGRKYKDNESEENDNANNNKVSFDLCIMLREEQYPLLARRLYKELEGMELYEVFRTAALKHPQVCKAFIAELKTKSYAELKSLFLHQRTRIEKIVSKRNSILEGSEDIDQWSEEREVQRLFVDERMISNEIIRYVRVISWVIYYGHNEILKFIIQQTEKHHEEGELFMSARNLQHGHTDNEGIKMSIATRAEPSDQCIDINSALEQIRLLLLSCYSGDVKTLDIILSHVSLPLIDGTYHNDADKTEYLSLKSPLTVTCSRGHAVMTYKLLKAGADVNNQDGNRDTPLVAACYSGHMDVVRVLVEEKADVNLQDGFGNTSLVVACLEGHVSVVEFLVKVGADIRECDHMGSSPLVAACQKGNVSLVELLLKAGANIGESDENGHTPLVTACFKGHVDVVEFLMKAGADIRESDKNGHTPLGTACFNGHVSVVEFLMKSGANIGESDKIGHAPLVTACFQGHFYVVDELLKAKAYVNFKDRKGNTPLVTACHRGHLGIVELLLKAGADIRKSDAYGSTPMVAACREGHVGVLECLRKAGADVRESDKNGKTPLLTACSKGHVEVVEWLIKAGVEINKGNKNGYTPLIAACIGKHIHVVDKLVELGANVNLQSENGRTPLGYASYTGNVNMVKILLKYGVHINHRDREGKTALDIAYGKGEKSVIEELEKALDSCQSKE